MSKVKVSEQFFSIQGEGPHAGHPAIFLRLSGCNLVCGGKENLDRDPENFEPEGDATWVCDTIDVWREADEVLSPSELLSGWNARGWIQSLLDGTHLVLTGGEPTLPNHQEAFVKTMAEFIRAHGTVPFVEVETNGTMVPTHDFNRYVDQYNVSMKLSNSGMDYDKRIDESAIRFHIETHESPGSEDAKFKFVVSERDDLVEILELQDEFDIPDSMISVMPAGYTQEDLRETYPFAAEVAQERNWDFSPRLHVDCWDQATGV